MASPTGKSPPSTRQKRRGWITAENQPPGAAAHRWKPGQSGNPEGFSKAKREAQNYFEKEALRRWEALVRSWLDQAIGHTEDMSPEEIAIRQKAVATGLQKPPAEIAKLIAERVMGRVPQALEHSGAIEVTDPNKPDLARFTAEQLVELLAADRRKRAEESESQG